MYVEQLEFEIDENACDAWLAEARSCLAALAREPDGVCFRLWRELDAPRRFVLLATWREGGGSSRGGRATREPGLLRDASSRSGFELLDMGWGRESEAFLRAGVYADHISAAVGPGKWELWRPYARNFVSVMVRQPGMVSEEMLRSRDDPERFVALRVFVSPQAARVGPEFEPPQEVRLAAEAGEALGVYQGAPPPRYRLLELVEGVWGVEGRAACDDYVRGLLPV
jgi:quinol monooxygenase YgiN